MREGSEREHTRVVPRITKHQGRFGKMDGAGATDNRGTPWYRDRGREKAAGVKVAFPLLARTEGCHREIMTTGVLLS
jgi:hypothetical protein